MELNIWSDEEGMLNRAKILWFDSEQKLSIIGDPFTKKIFMLIELTSNESITKSQTPGQIRIIFYIIFDSPWLQFAFMSFLRNFERFALIRHIECFQLAHTRLLTWLNCLLHKVIRNYWLLLTNTMKYSLHERISIFVWKLSWWFVCSFWFVLILAQWPNKSENEHNEAFQSKNEENPSLIYNKRRCLRMCRRRILSEVINH